MWNAILAVAIIQTFTWILSVFKKDSSLADLAWGIGVAAAGFGFLIPSFAALAGEDLAISSSMLVIVALVAAWALRLSSYLTLRNWGQPEDRRYQKFRAKDPANYWWRSYFRVFVLQGTLMLVAAAPFWFVDWSWQASTPVEWIPFGLGVLIAAWGLFQESVSDWQLYQFRKNPQNAGQRCLTGFWKRARHPNYGGEILFWWGIAIANLQWGHPETFLGFIGPAFMTWAITKLSGVPLLQNSLNQKKGQAPQRLYLPI